jgi:hypothetical protein
MAEYIDLETGLIAYQGDILLAYPNIDPDNFVAPDRYVTVIDAPKPLLPFDQTVDLVLIEEDGVYKKTWTQRAMTAEELQVVQDLIGQRDALIAKKLAEAAEMSFEESEESSIIEPVVGTEPIVETGTFTPSN